MKKYEDILIWAVVILLFLFVPKIAATLAALLAGGLLLFLGGLFLLLVGDLIKGDKEAKKRRKFKQKNEGKYFLWYSSNKRLKTVIDKELKPLLGIEFELVYNNRETVETSLSETEWRYLLAETNSIKFPRLITIRNGQVVAESFHKEVHGLRFLEMDKEFYKRNIELKLKKIKQ